MLFFPVELAIALTGVVHFFNNVFKLFLVGKNADKQILLRFGIPAIIFAAIGAWLLVQLISTDPLFTYHLGTRPISVYPVKFLIGILLMFFALMELIPAFKKIQFSKNHLVIGGALSGFFGGLSGNQGALRSAFLIKAGMSKEVFIATSVVISCLVDFTRLAVYSTQFINTGLKDNLAVVLSATLAAIAGAFIGNKLLKKVTFKTIQLIVGVMLIILSLGLASGLI